MCAAELMRAFKNTVGVCQLCPQIIKGIQASFHTFVFDQSAREPEVAHSPFLASVKFYSMQSDPTGWRQSVETLPHWPAWNFNVSLAKMTLFTYI